MPMMQAYGASEVLLVEMHGLTRYSGRKGARESEKLKSTAQGEGLDTDPCSGYAETWWGRRGH